MLRQLEHMFKPACDAWLRFWFTPGDPIVLGVLRWLVGGMLVYTHIVWGLNLHAFFGPDGWHSLEAITALNEGQYIYSFWYLVPVDWMWTVHLLCLAILVMFTIGLATPATSVLSLIITISYCYRAQIANYGLDQINGTLLFYLMIGGAGGRLSVDSLLRAWRTNTKDDATPPTMRAGLGLRLIQFHYCVIYFFAGTSKLQGDTWWTGEAMWLTLANYDYQTLDMTWLAQFPWLLNFVTHLTVVWELSFAFLIWNPRLRPFILLIGAAIHAGIGACLGMWTFGLIMIFGYTAYVPAEFFHRIFRRNFRGRTSSDPSHRLLLLLLIVVTAGCRDGLHNPDVMLERAYMLEQRGEVEEAIQCYSNALRMLPEDDARRATIHYDRGVAYGLGNNMTDAIADYTAAIKREPDMAIAYTNRAACFANLGQFEKALADLQKSIDLDPTDPLAFRNLGQVHHDLGHFDAAINDYQQAIEIDPTNPFGYFYRGELSLDLKQYDEAITDFTIAVNLNRDLASAFALRGSAYRESGRKEKAEADFKTAKSIDPEIEIPPADDTRK